MDRFVVLVDAGSLLSSVAGELAGEAQRRRVRIEPEAFVGALMDWCRESVTMPILRLYWYDGALDQATTEHRRIAGMDDVKLRLGRVVQGKQKGVDSLVYGDLIELFENRAIDTVVLIASDGDFTDAVERCQRRGVRVELVTVGAAPASLSPELRSAVDSVRLLPIERLAPFVKILPQTATKPSTGPSRTRSQRADLRTNPPDDQREAACLDKLLTLVAEHAVRFRDRVDSDAAKVIMQGFPAIPKDGFGEMMLKCSATVGAMISGGTRQTICEHWRLNFKARHQELKTTPVNDAAGAVPLGG